MTITPNKYLAGFGATVLLAAGGSQIAAAKSKSAKKRSSAAASTEVVLTGATKTSVENAVLAALPGATIQRSSTETDGKSTDAYEVHATKADGTHVEVLLDSSDKVTAINVDKRGGRHGHGPGHNGETPVTGDTLASITSAVKAKYPGSTVEFASTENDGKAGDAYEAHVRLADGGHLKVLLDSSFAITGSEADNGPGGPGGPGGDGPGVPPAATPTATP